MSLWPGGDQAKRTLATYGISGNFVDMDKSENMTETRKAMAAITGRTSVPQIWINQEHIGGCDDLKALDATGDLGMELKALRDQPSLEDAEADVSKKGDGTSAAVT
ncbi:unnamed protein product, partial [Sphacelaria rigidula]